MSDAAISGVVAPGWEPVRDAFVANFTERAEVGASVCVYRDGVPVVDLWGGRADPVSGRPWASDTIVSTHAASASAEASMTLTPLAKACPRM